MYVLYTHTHICVYIFIYVYYDLIVTYNTQMYITLFFPVLECSEPRLTLQNGTIFYKDYLYGSNLTYICDHGFYFEQEDEPVTTLVSFCDIIGSDKNNVFWTISNPPERCLRKLCVGQKIQKHTHVSIYM